MDPHHRDDRGQALPVVLLLLAGAVLTSMLLVAVGRVVIDRAQARTAADAAALAAAGADPETAAEVARRNGGQWPNVYDQGDGTHRVTLAIGDVVAAATARRIDPPPIEGTGSRVGLAPAMLAALARADDLLGQRVPITSGYRSIEHQRRLWEQRHLNPYPVARPGASRHHTGLAIDVPSSFVPTLLSVARDAGLCRPLPVRDPIHFEVCGGR
ncbi:MAG: M15 family metallopeptidase [Actinomycetota bacterium]